MTSAASSSKMLVMLIFLMGLTLSVLIFILNAYFLILANLIPAAICSVYLIAKFKKYGPSHNEENNGKGTSNKKLSLPPFIVFGLLAIPPAATVIISFFSSFNIYYLVISFMMPQTFMYIFFYVPLAIYDKYFFQKKYNAASTASHTLRLVSVIVPAYNEEAIIKKTLDSVVEADYPNKEIIVVDDGSTDRTYAIASQYTQMFSVSGNNNNNNHTSFLVITKPNGGKASAINYALRFARGHIVIVIDADSVIERSMLKEMARQFEYPNVVGVAGKVSVLNQTNILANCIALEVVIGVHLLRPPFSLFGVVPIVPGASGAFDKKTMVQRGLYDKDTLTEDFDITLKILKSKGRAVGIDSVSYTEVPTTLKGLYKQRTRWNRGNFQSLIKHRDIMTTNSYGMLQKFAYPITLFMFFIPPLLDMIVTAFAIITIINGTWMLMIAPLLLFIALQFILSAIAIVLSGGEKLKLILYAPFAIIGYKQIINFIILKSILDVLARNKKKLRWT